MAAKTTMGQLNKLAQKKWVKVTNYPGQNMHIIVLPCGLQRFAKDRNQAHKWVSALPDITVEMAQRALAEELMEDVRSVSIEHPGGGHSCYRRLVVLVDTKKTLEEVTASVGTKYMGYPVIVVTKLTDLKKTVA